MFERILIPLDGSPRAELVLAQVGRLLRREDSEILLLRTFSYPAWSDRMDIGAWVEAEREAAQKYVHDLARRLADKGAKVHARVAEGPAAETILETARTEGATMIAMTTHGRSGVARWFLGSVAEKVVRASNVPVLLVRSFRRHPLGDLEPVDAVEMPFRKILVPTDGSSTAMAAVTPAEKMALLFGSEAVVLHVRPPVFPPGALLPGMELGAPMPPPPPLPESDEITEKAAARFRHSGVPVRQVVAEGDPGTEIIDHEFAAGTDLIVMATHGRSGMARWMLGSVAERVIRHSGIPLLIVRAPVPESKSGAKTRKAGVAAGAP